MAASKAQLDDGREVTPAMFQDALTDEMERVNGEVGDKAYDGGRFADAIGCSRTCRSPTSSRSS